MGIITLIIFGGIVGWLAGLFVNKPGGIFVNIILGIIGSMVGGFIMNFFGFDGITGFNLYSMFVGVLGAVILVSVARMFR